MILLSNLLTLLGDKEIISGALSHPDQDSSRA